VKNRQLLGILGSAILFVGVFLPIVRLPVVGDMNYFQNGRGDGVIVLVLSIVSLVLVLIRSYRELWTTALGSAAVLAFTFFNLQSTISEGKRQMESDLKDNPFRGLADLAMQSVQLQWGWAALIIGVALLISVAAMRDAADEWAH
jgi:hypothetical protein